MMPYYVYREPGSREWTAFTALMLLKSLLQIVGVTNVIALIAALKQIGEEGKTHVLLSISRYITAPFETVSFGALLRDAVFHSNRESYLDPRFCTAD